MYLDTTITEVIPGSHKITSTSVLSALLSYSKRVQLKLNPGDVLVLYSTVLHRGVFTEKLPHRRLIQVFDCFKNQAEYDAFARKIIHIPGKETFSKAMISISKNRYLIPIVNAYGYLNFASGHNFGSKKKFMKTCLNDTFEMLSSEGLQERIVVKPGTMHKMSSTQVCFSFFNVGRM